MKTVFIVSPHFPPSSLAGVHRARHLAKHLPAFGWTPIIIRVDESYYTERNDYDLASLVPNDLTQIRTGAISARVARRAGIGDIGLRGYAALRRAMLSAVEQHDPRLIMITGSPFYPMMLSSTIKSRLNKPVLLDFQDPWVSRYGATVSPMSKSGLSHRLACTLEPRALRHANFVTSVSDIQNQEMALRYPWLNADRMAAIPIGGDPDDFEFLRQSDAFSFDTGLDPDCVNISYVGTFLPRAGDPLKHIFRAVSLLRDTHPQLAARLKLHFIGTSNQPGFSGSGPVMPIAHAENVADFVREVPDRRPYLEALAIQARSQALLLIGSDEPHYTASKIYPALMSKTPFLSLFHGESSAHDILQKAGGGFAYALPTGPDNGKLTENLRDGLCKLIDPPRALKPADPKIYEPFTARNTARRYAEIFDRMSSGGN